jgi:acyl-CoA thioesterase-1
LIRALLFTFLATVTLPAGADATKTKRLVIIGDSLTEGYGVSRAKAWPALLQKKIEALGKPYEVINAGISGSTAASAPSRMAWQLKSKPDLILLALGANDGLRGTSVKAMEENLSQALAMAKKEKIAVYLAGNKIPPNYGKAYTADFEAAFKRVADKHSVPLLPFILLGVGGVTDLNLADGIHPNEKGHKIVAETVFTFLRKYL